MDRTQYSAATIDIQQAVFMTMCRLHPWSYVHHETEELVELTRLIESTGRIQSPTGRD